MNFPFSISKSKKSVINTATVIQFPLRLAFACTAHKIQGATIPKPQKVIINVTDTFAAAMVYVMLSRVCTLEQIYILNKFDEAKMYPNTKALKISSLNCRSLKKHHSDMISDVILLKSDIICLQEMWLEDDEAIDDLKIPNYDLYLNSKGRGKGVAAYCRKDKFRHETDIKRGNMQISKYSSDTLDIIVIYRSQQGNYDDLNQILEEIKTDEKPHLVLGDLNFCYLDNPNNPTRKYLENQRFTQIITRPTHIEGNLLDQAYLRDDHGELECTMELHSKYYTDHKGLAIIIRYLVHTLV